MTPEIINNYKSIFVECLTSLSEELLPSVLAQIESVKDDVVELREAFEEKKGGQPAHWITLFRFIRFASVLSAELKTQYDPLIAAHQKLSEKQDQNEDEIRFINEAGEALYAVDDMVGQIDRLLMRLLKMIRPGMIETFGIVLKVEEKFYTERIDARQMDKLEPQLEELTDLCYRMMEQDRVMHALLRMQKLLLG